MPQTTPIKQLVENEVKFYPLTAANGVFFSDGTFLSGKTFISSATYNSTSKKIEFYEGSTKKFELDATAFIKDGMVSSATISNGNLVITFNTDAGTSPITIPLTDIFNANNYYTKTQTDTNFVSKSDYESDEEVISIALNDLYNRIPTKTSDLTNDSGFLGESEERVISAALNDLNDRKQNNLTFDSIPTINSTNPVTSDGIFNALKISGEPIEITYNGLVTLKNNNQLNPGSLYKIIDYEFTSAEIDIVSKQHPFDIIVLALTENSVSEEAFASQHAGDTYFSNSNLGAWKLWYCLEPTVDVFGTRVQRPIEGTIEFHSSQLYKFNNWTNRFHWDYPNTVKDALANLDTDGVLAESTVSQGTDAFKTAALDMGWNEDTVIYTLANKYCPGSTQNRYYIWSAYFEKSEVDNGNITKVLLAGRTSSTYGTLSYQPASIFRFQPEQVVTGGSKGLIYRMIDEFNNDVDYDFKNKGIQLTGQSTGIGSDEMYTYNTAYIPNYSVYTFTHFTLDENEEETISVEDISLNGNVKNNIIRTDFTSNTDENYNLNNFPHSSIWLTDDYEHVFENNVFDHPYYVELKRTNVKYMTVKPLSLVNHSGTDYLTNVSVGRNCIVGVSEANLNKINIGDCSTVYLDAPSNNNPFYYSNILIEDGCAFYSRDLGDSINNTNGAGSFIFTKDGFYKDYFGSTTPNVYSNYNVLENSYYDYADIRIVKSNVSFVNIYGHGYYVNISEGNDGVIFDLTNAPSGWVLIVDPFVFPNISSDSSYTVSITQPYTIIRATDVQIYTEPNNDDQS